MATANVSGLGTITVAPPNYYLSSAAGGSGGLFSSLGFGGVTSIVGSVLQIGSSIYGGILQNQISKANAMVSDAQGRYQSAVAEYNAAVARANAEAIRTIANLDIERQKKAAETFRSGQVAGYSKAGVKLEGSPISVMIDSAQQAKLDIAITDYNAKVGILQAESKGTNYQQEGKLAKSFSDATSNLMRTSGRFAQGQGIASGVMGVGQTLLQTVPSFSR